AEATEGGALLHGAVRAAGYEARRKRLGNTVLTATDAHDTLRVVDLDDGDSALGLNVADLAPSGELVLLLAEPQRVDERPLVDDRWLGGVLGELADRLAVLDEFLGRHFEPVEVRPPDRLLLAPVVMQELPHHPT